METSWQYLGYTIKKVYDGEKDDGSKRYRYEIFSDGIFECYEYTLEHARFYCENGYSIWAI